LSKKKANTTSSTKLKNKRELIKREIQKLDFSIDKGTAKLQDLTDKKKNNLPPNDKEVIKERHLLEILRRNLNEVKSLKHRKQGEKENLDKEIYKLRNQLTKIEEKIIRKNTYALKRG